jgi:hypothetical protein
MSQVPLAQKACQDENDALVLVRPPLGRTALLAGSVRSGLGRFRSVVTFGKKTDERKPPATGLFSKNSNKEQGVVG